jgi:hypothetical protein
VVRLFFDVVRTKDFWRYFRRLKKLQKNWPEDHLLDPLTMNLDIRKSNNATIEMAIANFFHCKNILDAVVESTRFIQLVRVCRLVGEDFVVPHQKQIGGELLDLNYANVYKQNKANLLKFAKVFGLAYLVDGATIHQMALMNILAMSGTFPPMMISI